ncbi:hypothetical protein K1719_010002 [Acacia pycnantha]|nr:hypothetical protein K1719_010002 [Acacia pycnantha]
MDPADMELHMTARSLYHFTQQGVWNEALTTFKNNPGIHKMPINTCGDTLLHVVVNDNKDDRVAEIVDEIKKNQSWSVLGTENDRGDTPLHCAASIGSLKMCKAIAEAQGGYHNQLKIEEARNKNKETPLFLAALHGHKDAFLYLHSRCPDHQSSGLWKRTSDGETVLHCTIRREHFDEKNEEIKKVDVDHNKLKARGEGKKNSGADTRESALFIAARNGVLEIVKKILGDKARAIHETNSHGQSVLHVAVEHRQPYIIEIIKKEKLGDGLIHSLDNDGNCILHAVAKSKFQIQGSSALEMQHEIKWYEYVKSLVPSYLTFLPNYEGETPEDIFLADHKDLVQKSDEWLCRTSESCSVVAVLVAGVAFATSSTVPGGNDDKTGKPTLDGKPGFDLFAISALIALCFSVTALILFLSVLTSRKHPADFLKKLPVKLFLALSSLFVSIFSMFISFCAAHSFELVGKSMKSVLLLYAIICLPVSFTIVEFSLYMDLFKGIFMKVQPPYNLKRI